VAVVCQKVLMGKRIFADNPGNADGRQGDEDEVATNEMVQKWSKLRHAEAPSEGSAEEAKIRNL
jgi:hypothetical protein